MQAEDKRGALFGLDVGAWWQYWRAGWRELLWGRSVGLRRKLEAPVALEDADRGETHFFLAEAPLDNKPSATQKLPAFLSSGPLAKLFAGDDSVHPALLLPADQALVRTLVLPRSLETELEATIAFEVQANSPFLAEDTCHGWAIYKREGDLLHVALVIAAISDVYTHLSRHGYSVAAGHSTEVAEALPEIWCLVSEEIGPVVLQGFGEHRRQADYRRRLYWLGGATAYILVVAIAVLAVPGLVRHMQADNMSGHLAHAQTVAAEAMALRDSLAADNQRVSDLQALIDSQVDHHALLDYMATQAGDDVFFHQFDVDAERVRVRGWSTNAAAFMQLLTEDPVYAEVKAPSGIRRDARTGLEQFVLELRLDRERFAAAQNKGAALAPEEAGT